MSDRVHVRTVIETRLNAPAASHRDPLSVGVFLLLILLSLMPVGTFAQDAELPAEAPNLPANLRSLVPRGWVATSFAEGDFNKDGVTDRAALISLRDTGPQAPPPIAGVPTADPCHNLLLQLGQANGGFTPPNFIAWPSDRDNSPQPDPTNQPRECTPTDEWESRALKAVRGTLRTELTVEIEDFLDFESNVLRVENQCLRLIGRETEHVSYPEEFRDETSINFLTRNRIDTHTTFGWNGGTEKPTEKKVSKTSRIEETAPICVNDTPLLLGPAAPQSGTPAPRPVAPPTPAGEPIQQPRPPAPTTNGSQLQSPAPANQPTGPMTVEELWRNPPPGSRISWARWSDDKEESYLRLPDGSLFTRPGITVWSTRGPIRLSKVSKEILPTNLAACPDSPWSDEPHEHDGIECRGHSTWESVIGFTTTGQTAWGGFASDESDATFEAHEGLSEEYEWEAWTDSVVASDSRGILIQTSMNAEGGGAHPLEETTWQWIDPGTGAPIERAWPKGALEGVRTHFLSERDSIEDYDCRSISAAECEQQVSEAKAELLERGGPLQPVYFEPVAACGRITRWRWTATLMLSWAERMAEQQWTESSITPTDIEPNPIVDCTYRPGFDGPSAVGWSAVVR